jgi:hypothetical protein
MKRILQPLAFWFGVVMLVVAVFFGCVGLFLSNWSHD